MAGLLKLLLVGMGIFGVTFTGTTIVSEQQMYEHEQEVFEQELQAWVHEAPSTLDIGEIDPTEITDEEIEKLHEQGKVIVRYKGVITGRAKDGQPVYSLENPQYLIFDRNDMTGEKAGWEELEPIDPNNKPQVHK